MSLDKVRAAVTKNAVAEAEAILVQARTEASAIVNAAKEKVAAERLSFDAETASILDIQERRSTSEANARAKATVLDAKRRALDATYATARERLVHLGGDERQSLIASLCRDVARDGVTARVRAAPVDVAIVVRELPNAAVVADTTIMGGLIASNADGTVLVDRTFDTVLAETYERELLAVSRILFGEEKRR